MKKFNSLSKVGVSLMSALMFAPLLMGNVSASASQTNTDSNSSDVQNTNTSNNSVSSTVDSNSNSSNDDSDGTTNIFNIPSSISTDADGLNDSLYAAHTTAYIKKHYYDNLSPANRAAKLWVALHESTYNYFKTNPYNNSVYGRFQLTRSYLHGDYSKINQERTADKYVKNRYGSWVNAKAFWLSNARKGGAMKYGWYSMDN